MRFVKEDFMRCKIDLEQKSNTRLSSSKYIAKPSVVEEVEQILAKSYLNKESWLQTIHTNQQ